MEIKSNNGEKAEIEFRKWLDKNNIPYLYIQQDTKVFSAAFWKDYSGKRPDFLILIPSFGFIFVDVKDRKINTEYQTYPIDSVESTVYSSMQRKFNMHTWYVVSNNELGYKTWLWIPVSKVLESGVKLKVSSKSHESFFPIPLDQFIQIAEDDSLERLFSKLFK